MNNPYNNPAMQFSDIVQRAIRPLNKLQVTQLNYEKIFLDGSRSCLDSTPEAVIANFIERDTFSTFFTPNFYRQAHFLYIHDWVQTLLPNMRDAINNSLDTLRHKADRDHEFAIIKPGHNYFEILVFATGCDNVGFLTNCINNLDLLKQFGRHFCQEHAELIQRADNDRIVPAWNPCTEKQVLPAQFSMTPRERQCADLLLRGHTAKRIGQQLHISPRTVETHINNLKHKMSCRNKSDLIQQLMDINHNPPW